MKEQIGAKSVKGKKKKALIVPLISSLVTITAHGPPGLICSPQTSGSYLLVVRSQYDPPTEGVAEVDHAGTAAETQHFGEGCFHG